MMGNLEIKLKEPEARKMERNVEYPIYIKDYAKALEKYEEPAYINYHGWWA